MRLALSLLSLAVVLACAPPDRVTAPRQAAPRADEVAAPDAQQAGTPTDVTRFLLERAADGLLYTSESDYPFTYVFRQARATAPLTVEEFRAVVGLPPDAPVETISLDDFFARHIERVDPYDDVAVALVPRYRVLRETIRHAVREPVVFRVGRIAIDCYVVGTDWEGNVVGLTTVAIET